MSQSWALAGIFVAATVVVSCGGSTTRTPTPTAMPATPSKESTTVPPPPPGFVQASPQPTLVPLTNDQRRQVEAIIRADPTIADIVGDIAYTVSDLGPWYAATVPATGEDLIGGFGSVLLSRSIPHVERDWPFTQRREYYEEWPADARTKYLPYTQGTEKQAVDNLRVMEVEVDLPRGKVTAINLMDDSQYGQTVTTLHTEPTPQTTLGVSKDAQNIFDADQRLAAILSGRPYHGPSSFTYSLESPHLHFAYEIFLFDQPQDIDADWPLVVDGDLVTGQYQADTIQFLANGVRSISATVDLDSGQLISIEPSQHSPGD